MTTSFAHRAERIMSARSGRSSPTATRTDGEAGRRAALDALFRARVPAKYADCRLEHIATLSGDGFSGTGVFIDGNPGIGKTYAATAIARAYIAAIGTTRPHPVTGAETFLDTALAWVTVPRFMCRIRSTMNRRGGDTALDVMEEYGRALVLVLDDLGAEKATDYAAEAVYDLLSDRINHRKFTIVTSNLTRKEIAEWRPGIASRLSEFRRVVLPDVDRRLGK